MAHTEEKAKRPIRTLRNYFIAGLFVAAPLFGTFWILRVLYEQVKDWGYPIVARMPQFRWIIDENAVVPFYLRLIADAIAVLIPILVVIFLGVMATNVLGKRVLAWIDALLLRVPFVAGIYRIIKQVFDSFRQMGATEQFEAVAYVDYPVPGHRLLGFITGRYQDPVLKREMTAVFLPTAPNPLTGFVVMVDSELVVLAPFSLEEGFKMIVSAGLIANPTGVAARVPGPPVVPATPASA